jgi:hypothetical protein
MNRFQGFFALQQGWLAALGRRSHSPWQTRIVNRNMFAKITQTSALRARTGKNVAGRAISFLFAAAQNFDAIPRHWGYGMMRSGQASGQFSQVFARVLGKPAPLRAPI